LSVCQPGKHYEGEGKGGHRFVRKIKGDKKGDGGKLNQQGKLSTKGLGEGDLPTREKKRKTIDLKGVAGGKDVLLEKTNARDEKKGSWDPRAHFKKGMGSREEKDRQNPWRNNPLPVTIGKLIPALDKKETGVYLKSPSEGKKGGSTRPSGELQQTFKQGKRIVGLGERNFALLCERGEKAPCPKGGVLSDISRVHQPPGSHQKGGETAHSGKFYESALGTARKEKDP